MIIRLPDSNESNESDDGGGDSDQEKLNWYLKVYVL